jgi:hypothetical protein
MYFGLGEIGGRNFQSASFAKLSLVLIKSRELSQLNLRAALLDLSLLLLLLTY